ncbi:glycosyltransferase family 2 protein [Parvularcula oceani]|uniref:glycosyltransferase family 2 protein n=1 Tax=Parvularcula oceani TaxID=1247963 RepID=UPI0004E26976|nr:glycosyltransferase family 2 protein [Parvularcula oceani]
MTLVEDARADEAACGDADPARGQGGFARLRLLSCVGVDLELALLPHFLEHYLSLGIDPAKIALIFNTADAASPALEEADRMLAERGIAPARRWIAPYTSEAMWAQRRALQAELAEPGDWIVNADVDEMHVYPAPLPEIVAELEAEGLNCVQGVMIDRLAPGGALAAVEADRPLAEQFPVRADVALSIIGTGENHGVAGTTKLMLHSHDVLPKRGGHTVHNPAAERYAAGTRLSVFPGASDPAWRADFPFQVDHYKWTATLRGSLERRLKTKGVSVAGREYGSKIDRYLSAHGRIRLEDACVLDEAPREETDWRGQLAAMRRSAPYWKVRNAVRHKVLFLRSVAGRALGR